MEWGVTNGPENTVCLWKNSGHDVERKVREELAKEGFGVLTEIDVKKSLPRCVLEIV